MWKFRPQYLVIILLFVFVIAIVASQSGGDCDNCGGICDVDTAPSVQIIEPITAEEAFVMVQNNAQNEGFVVIDTRTQQEFETEHIENAVNLDYTSTTFRDDVNDIAKDGVCLVYGQTTDGTEDVLQLMKELGFREVYSLSGGISEWKTQGLPTAKL